MEGWNFQTDQQSYVLRHKFDCVKLIYEKPKSLRSLLTLKSRQDAFQT